MPELPATVTGSHVWKGTLAARENDAFGSKRERLRTGFTGLRQRAALLAGEIRRDLPALTLHDITHLDALWETASTIAGEAYSLTPTEGFVLGGAFLLHDLGMALPAVEGGIVALKSDPRWADLVTYEYQTSLDRLPSPDEIANPVQEIHNRVLLSLLQQIHAANAEQLIFLSFSAKDSPDRIHLMDDPELRQIFGRIIGRVANSHWWSLNEVEREFGRTMGPPHWCPPAWTVDPLKLACILRCADAAQIDGRRAPMLLRAALQLPAPSDSHWSFQEKLNKPYLAKDTLIFTTGHAFSMSEATAWWICLETLRMVNGELGSVDALFADKGYPRFAARRVAGVDSPERLVSYIQTDGWLPINATIHVTDLPRVIKSLGGKELYGERPEVALRELIQNASDAIHARRVYERRPANYGAIRILLTKSSDGCHWLEVCDDGVGMSKDVLTHFLLDFGHAFWGSSEMQREFPGLLSSGIKQIGKYGIGFFAVFMLAEHVQVITRRSDAAAKDTLVLEFSTGLKGRPILRVADNSEQLMDGGTRIRVKLKTDPFADDGFLRHSYIKEARSLADLCIELCPSLEVDLFVEQEGSSKKIITGCDWQTMNSLEFLERMPVLRQYKKRTAEEVAAFRKKAAANVRVLRDRDGVIVGRAFLTAGFAFHEIARIDLYGIVTVGGLASCSLTGISGVLVGTPMRAARDVARPLVDDDELRRWAEEQAALVPALWEDPKSQVACAQYVRLCGGDTGDLPICLNRGNWCSASDIRTRTDLPDQLVLLEHSIVDHELSLLESYTLNDNVFVVGASSIPGLLQCSVAWPQNISTNFGWGSGNLRQTLGGTVVESIAQAWGVGFEAVIESNDLENETKVVIGSVGERELSVPAIPLRSPTYRKQERDSSNKAIDSDRK